MNPPTPGPTATTGHTKEAIEVRLERARHYVSDYIPVHTNHHLTIRAFCRDTCAEAVKDITATRAANKRLHESLTAANYGDVPAGWDKAIERFEKAEAELTALRAAHEAQRRALEGALNTIEQYALDVRDKAALIANNAPEEKERFVGRQIIILCEKMLIARNQKSNGALTVARLEQDKAALMAALELTRKELGVIAQELTEVVQQNVAECGPSFAFNHRLNSVLAVLAQSAPSVSTDARGKDGAT